jgi:hypothetical protein
MAQLLLKHSFIRSTLNSTLTCDASHSTLKPELSLGFVKTEQSSIQTRSKPPSNPPSNPFSGVNMSLDAQTYLTDKERLKGDVNDVESIMSMTNRDAEAELSLVESHFDSLFTWDYAKGKRPQLNKLYEKAKQSQWDGEKDLDWSIDVDVEKVAAELSVAAPGDGWIRETATNEGLFKGWGDKEWLNLGVEAQNWRLSQFMHGEQGALICTARITETVPWYDAKLFAATQVVDEARHVEVFAKYLDTKLNGYYPINAHLEALLNDIIRDSRWDMTYLGMQIMVEGLALAAFGFLHMLTNEPLLKNLLRYVMSDEARHVAFGVLSLKEVYADMSAADIRERQEFTYEAGIRMRDRFLMQEVWERMGVDVRKMVQIQLALPNEYKDFQRLLFSKIVPNCKKLGLLDAGDGWLRQKWTEQGVIEFENWADTSDEYLALDAFTTEGAVAS